MASGKPILRVLVRSQSEPCLEPDSFVMERNNVTNCVTSLPQGNVLPVSPAGTIFSSTAVGWASERSVLGKR
jgi:hypothetical protein